ncbi:MAG: M48 family metalloprotease [Sinobacteraceae bacterium]|nr:M48 family metalloprotease [Nevskiaceae bacterium]
MNAVTAEFVMEDLVYPRERVLGNITLVLGVLVWVVLLVCTVGTALIVLGLGALLSLFVHSALIAHLRGNAVELSEAQFPDLYAQFVECCRRLKIDTPPQAFILNGNGILNAFATKFLRTQYVVLTSDVVDAMQGSPEGLRFYMGHELGHLRMKHVSKQFLRWPVMWLPLLGAAYSRARESTCDRHGLACSGSVESAVRALGVLSVGRARWRNLNVATYIRQTEHSRGFWMSFHELTAGYPWLTKRAARLTGDPAAAPPRNPFAYFFALFVPYGGRLGSGFTMLIMIYVVGILAATAIPKYQTYVIKAKLTEAAMHSEPVREKLAQYYLSNHRVPDSLDTVGVAAQLPNGATLSLDSRRMVLTVTTKQGELIFVPSDDHGRIVWQCRPGAGLKATQLPLSCQNSGGQ